MQLLCLSGLRHGQQKKKIEKMYTSIAAEQCNEYGTVIKKHQPHQQGQWSSWSAKKPKIDIAGIDNESDPDDDDFASDRSLTGSSEDDDTEIDEAQPLNAEVYFTWYFDPYSHCIDCRYPPFENHSDHWMWVREVKEEQNNHQRDWRQGQFTKSKSTVSSCNWELLQFSFIVPF